jgi:hypothetical protein
LQYTKSTSVESQACQDFPGKLVRNGFSEFEQDFFFKHVSLSIIKQVGKKQADPEYPDNALFTITGPVVFIM